jgi:antitoxin component YwqK of YwqJK toxin-antitoxin module
MKISLIFLSLVIFINACNYSDDAKQNESSANGSSIPKGKLFRMESIPGSGNQIATKKDSTGIIIEEGITDAKGLKNGTWVIYQGEGGYPAKIANYVNGVYNGPYFEFDGFGQISLRASYKNNKLHGNVAKFLNGDLAQESNYKEGILDGVYKEYRRSGGIQKEINYKNGKLDGPFRYYDEGGKVSQEYNYRNGKQQ